MHQSHVIWLLFVFVILLPVGALLLSMGSYVGKILAMRVLFKNHQQKEKEKGDR